MPKKPNFQPKSEGAKTKNNVRRTERQGFIKKTSLKGTVTSLWRNLILPQKKTHVQLTNQAYHKEMLEGRSSDDPATRQKSENYFEKRRESSKLRMRRKRDRLNSKFNPSAVNEKCTQTVHSKTSPAGDDSNVEEEGDEAEEEGSPPNFTSTAKKRLQKITETLSDYQANGTKIQYISVKFPQFHQNESQIPFLCTKNPDFPKIEHIARINQDFMVDYYAILSPFEVNHLLGAYSCEGNKTFASTAFYRHLAGMNPFSFYSFSQEAVMKKISHINQSDNNFRSSMGVVFTSRVIDAFTNPQETAEMIDFIQREISSAQKESLTVSKMIKKVKRRFNTVKHLTSFVENDLEGFTDREVRKAQHAKISISHQFYAKHDPETWEKFNFLLEKVDQHYGHLSREPNADHLRHKLNRLMGITHVNEIWEPLIKFIFFSEHEDVLESDSGTSLEEPNEIKERSNRRQTRSEPLWPLMFILSTDADLQQFAKAKPQLLYVDGTRENSPIKGFQIVAVHYQQNEKPLTPLLMLVNRFSEVTYKKLFSFLSLHIDLRSVVLKIDFEIALRNAASHFGMNVSHCYFHYAKIIGSRTRRITFKKRVVDSAINPREKIDYKKDKPDPLVSTAIQEYLKKLIFVPQKAQKQVISAIMKTCRNPSEVKLVDGISSCFITGKHSTWFFLPYTDPFTNNIAENYFSAYSKQFSFKPSMTAFMETFNDHLIAEKIKRLFPQPDDSRRTVHRELEMFAKKLQSPGKSIQKIIEDFSRRNGSPERHAGDSKTVKSTALANLAVKNSPKTRLPNFNSLKEDIEACYQIQAGINVHSATMFRHIISHPTVPDLHTSEPNEDEDDRTESVYTRCDSSTRPKNSRKKSLTRTKGDTKLICNRSSSNFRTRRRDGKK